MTLVDTETGEIVGTTFSKSYAEAWVAKVNQTLDDLADLITDGFAGRVWIPLGYESWAELCESDLIAVPRLPLDRRRDLVGALRAEGLSTRAIGAAIGVSRNTVKKDISQVGQIDPPDAVTGTDGKTYKPKPKPDLAESLAQLADLEAQEEALGPPRERRPGPKSQLFDLAALRIRLEGEWHFAPEHQDDVIDELRRITAAVERLGEQVNE